jgi:hypothetical protein
MSVLATVAPAVTPLASPMVQVVTNTVHIPQIPADVISGINVLVVAFTGLVASLLHQVIERGKWSSNTNRIVTLVIAVMGTAGFAAFVNHFGQNWNALAQDGTALLVLLGSSQGRYLLFQLVTGLIASAATKKALAAPVAVTDPNTEVIPQNTTAVF